MGLSIGGLGSGIDTNALVASLMDAERIPQNRIATLQAAAQKRITAWNELRTRTATVQAAAEALATPSKALGAVGSSSDSSVVKVTATDGAQTTQLAVRVLSLATAQQSKVAGLTPGMAVGAGTTVLTSGLPGTGIGGVAFSAEAAAGVHTVSVTSPSTAAVAHGTAATSLGATDLTVTLLSGASASLTLSPSYPDGSGQTLAQDLQAQLEAALPGALTVSEVGGRLELRTRSEGSLAAFSLSGGAVAELGLPDDLVEGSSAVLSVDGERVELDPLAAGATATSTTVAPGVSLTLGSTLRAGTVTSNVVRTTATDTLADLQDKLNAAGSPVTATTLRDGDTSTLVLTARGTGTAGAVAVAPGGLALLDARTQVTAATDATLSLGPGLTVTRSSNRVTDLLPGVTLDLLRTSTGTDPVNVSVDRDASTTTTRAKALVDAMNALIGSVGTLTKYDADTRTSAPLTGDSTARSLVTSMFSTAAGVTGSGSLRSLSQLGIETTRDGTFVLKTDVLDKALSSSPGEAAEVLSQLGASLGAYAKGMAQTGGRISERRDGAQADVTARQKQYDAMEVRLTKTETRLKAQYASLEAAMGQLKLQQSSLTAALSGLSSS